MNVEALSATVKRDAVSHQVRTFPLDRHAAHRFATVSKESGTVVTNNQKCCPVSAPCAAVAVHMAWDPGEELNQPGTTIKDS